MYSIFLIFQLITNQILNILTHRKLHFQYLNFLDNLIFNMLTYQEPNLNILTS